MEPGAVTRRVIFKANPWFWAALLVLTALLMPRSARPVSADEGWVVKSFNATYSLRPDAVAEITEDIQVDFGGQQKHGIFRDIPVEYKVENDSKHDRVLTLSNINVDDGSKPWKFTSSRVGANLELKIGDADKTVSGPQRYRISYEVRGAFNAFDDHDEFFWNATGNSWPVPMNSVTMTGNAPANKIACFQGPRGSRTPCKSSSQGNNQRFETTQRLGSNDGLTVVVSMPLGLIDVPPPMLIRVKSPAEQVVDFMGLKPVPIALAILVAIAALSLVLRQWWVAGRDRWYGDVQNLSGNTKEATKPPFARETVVVEYTPPELPDKRRLRPAELGLLLDEHADTLDVSATIIDLAVRGYIHIEEQPKAWLLGKPDYKLTKLKEPDDALLPYESLLLTSLFNGHGDSVEMSALKNEFYGDLAQVKSSLESQGVSEDKLFANKPATVRSAYLWAGIALVLGGVIATFLLGFAGFGIVGIPLIVAGALMALLSGAMPRRTASGREMFRRSLGFRLYMTVAETDRQKFNEDANIFSEYLPYAIVMGCTDKWAERFKALESGPGSNGYSPSWYSGPGVFAPLLFASSIGSFTSSVSSAISSTPASSGSSGFSSGGGFSGGGFGGGGGGSW